MASSETPKSPKPTMLERARRFIRRAFRTVAIATFIWVGIHLVGLLPVNNDFKQTPDGVEVVVVSNEVHADLILPIKHGEIDWHRKLNDLEVSGDISDATHVAIGWGDKGFFIGTKTWSDLKLSTTANALLLPSPTCMHVNFISRDKHGNGKVIRLSQQQYEQLVAFVDSSFKRTTQGKPIQISNAAYRDTDAFFEANGRYHALNTCNSWVGRALKVSGVRVGVFTPLPKSVYLYLPDDAE